MNATTERIRALNDELRRNLPKGHAVMTVHERLRSRGGCQITFLYLCVVSEGLRSIKGR